MAIFRWKSWKIVDFQNFQKRACWAILSSVQYWQRFAMRNYNNRRSRIVGKDLIQSIEIERFRINSVPVVKSFLAIKAQWSPEKKQPWMFSELHSIKFCMSFRYIHVVWEYAQNDLYYVHVIPESSQMPIVHVCIGLHPPLMFFAPGLEQGMLDSLLTVVTLTLHICEDNFWITLRTVIRCM